MTEFLRLLLFFQSLVTIRVSLKLWYVGKELVKLKKDHVELLTRIRKDRMKTIFLDHE